MAKVHVYRALADGSQTVAIKCPGCLAAFPESHARHGLNVANVHTWNGDVDRPTFTPSLMWNHEFGGMPAGYICHSYITDGMIQFLSDCTHPLAGQTVELLDIE